MRAERHHKYVKNQYPQETLHDHIPTFEIPLLFQSVLRAEAQSLGYPAKSKHLDLDIRLIKLH